MASDQFPANYLGGHAEHPDPQSGCRLSIGADASLILEFTSVTGALQAKTRVLFSISPDAQVALSAGDPARMKQMAAGLTGVLIAGPIGGLIALAATSKTDVVALVAREGDRTFTVALAVEAGSGGRCIGAIQRARRSAGLEPLPGVEELARQAQTQSHQEQQDVLVEIRDLLREAVAALHRLEAR